MKILVINAGSSSLKYQLIDLDHSSVIAKGICERIGIPGSMISYKSAKGDKYEKQQDMKNHEDAIAMVLEVLADPEIGVIKNMSEIDAVGHRVLHGGEKLYDPILIDDEVLKAIEDCIPLGPLHNPANLMGIRGCMAVMPGVPMVAVFDTGWGMAMEKSHYMYALPYEAYENYKVRRYGFHGTSHRYVTGRALELLGNPNAKVITCHLGNGSSVSCSKAGKCVDTSMGLTPLEGLPMGTRCGSIDPAIMPFLMDKTGMTAKEMDTYMNKKSGMLGISGIYIGLTAEPNVNTGQPPLLLLQAAAHEMAHQLGIAAEDEAEFTAFLACMRASSPSIRYSGVMQALIRCGNALHAADAARYAAIAHDCYSDGMRRDLADYNAYWAAYEGPAREAADAANDGYLKHNAQPSGVQSYGESVDLLLALYAAGGADALFPVL